MTKYVMAKILLPIEIKDSNDYHLHSDRMNIEFETCTFLPPKTTNESSELISRLFSFYGDTQPNDNYSDFEYTEDEEEDEEDEEEEEEHESAVVKYDHSKYAHPPQKIDNSTMALIIRPHEYVSQFKKNRLRTTFKKNPPFLRRTRRIYKTSDHFNSNT
jgi:hypothetical protein